MMPDHVKTGTHIYHADPLHPLIEPRLSALAPARGTKRPSHAHGRDRFQPEANEPAILMALACTFVRARAPLNRAAAGPVELAFSARTLFARVNFYMQARQYHRRVTQITSG
jgi:hypothetical protein